MAHWKHTATRCAVDGCERTRLKGRSTCGLLAHHELGKALAGAGRIEPIPAPPNPLGRPSLCICHPDAVMACSECSARGFTAPNRDTPRNA